MLIPDTRAADRDANYQGFGSAAEEAVHNRKCILNASVVVETPEHKAAVTAWLIEKAEASERELLDDQAKERLLRKDAA